MGIQERKEKQKLEIRKAILEASIKLFKEEGFDNVSIRKIAEIIQYSPTTIEMIYEFTDTLNDIQDPVEKLKKMGEFYILFGLNFPEYYDLMLIQEAPMIHYSDLKLPDWKGANKVFNRLKEFVQDCVDQGKIPGENIELISITLWSTLHGLISLHVRRRLEKLVDKDTIHETMTKSLNWTIESLIRENQK
jgi:AcrR family transcriptional regulator